MEEIKSKRLLKSFFNCYCEDLKESFNTAISDIKSPIEQMLCGSLLSEIIVQGYGAIIQGKDDGCYFGLINDLDHIRITTQFPIGKYRVDFFIEYIEDGKVVKKLIVECDGHDFHEKTKEQAAYDKKRDRILQGIAPIFRFTGSEIYNKFYDCAYQIVEFITKGK